MPDTTTTTDLPRRIKVGDRLFEFKPPANPGWCHAIAAHCEVDENVTEWAAIGACLNEVVVRGGKEVFRALPVRFRGKVNEYGIAVYNHLVKTHGWGGTRITAIGRLAFSHLWEQVTLEDDVAAEEAFFVPLEGEQPE